MSTFRLVAALFVIAGCGGKYAGGTTAKSSRPGLDGAALPYQVLDARTGHQVEEAAFWPVLVQARAVCVGEDHPNPHHHWVQLQVVRELGKRLAKTDKLAVGLEMIQRPFQGPLDDFAAKRIDGATLRSRVGWAERWGYDWNFYGPTFEAAISFGARLLALNAPKELTKKVVRQGLDALTADEKAQVPELRLDDAAHRAWFDALMESMGGASVHVTKGKEDDASKEKEAPATSPPVANPHSEGDAPAMPSAERIYTVQVIWDETMADGAAKWLEANPNGHLVILAGNGHCHDSAIVNRLKRRSVTNVLSVRAVIDDDEGGVAEVLAKPINDYVLVLQLPKSSPAN